MFLSVACDKMYPKRKKEREREREREREENGTLRKNSLNLMELISFSLLSISLRPEDLFLELLISKYVVFSV